MKKIQKFFIIIFSILFINSTFAIEKSSINLEKNPKIENTDKNIKQAKLIENEVVIFKNKLKIIQKKYKLEKDTKINTSIKNLSKIIYILRKIQTTKVNKNTADSVIKEVISDLKNINNKTKNYLKNIKIKLDKEKIKYNNISNKLNKILDKVIKGFVKYYSDKKILTQKDKKIIKIISSLNNQSIKLKNYKYQNFSSKNDMKNYLIIILKQIKKDFKEIRNISKNK